MSAFVYPYGYNVISFDQRGMGRSSPTFVVEECTNDIDPILGLDVDDEASIRASARLNKARNLGCWNYPGFSISLDEDDETSKRFHFLEYSGTRQLAEDIERVRILFGGDKLSVYGISYGTAVMGTYTTIFPKHVNLMVLDGNMLPNYDIVEFSDGLARSTNHRIDYFIATCEMGNTQCGVSDMGDCVNSLYDIISDNRDYISGKYGISNMSVMMIHIITNLFGNYNLVPDICTAAQNNNLAQLDALIQELFTPPVPDSASSPETDAPTAVLVDPTPDELESKPTTVSDSWPWPGYNKFQGDATKVVNSQDFSMGGYSENAFVRFVKDINAKYPGAGTQGPAKNAAIWYGFAYYWPSITPISPMGNPNQGGIISGQIYDPATPYIFTQRMRENFPSATLLTSRSVNHGMTKAINNSTYGWTVDADDTDPVCQSKIERYFSNGVVDFVDGHVCESDPVGESCTVTDIINGFRGGQCSPKARYQVEVSTK